MMTRSEVERMELRLALLKTLSETRQRRPVPVPYWLTGAGAALTWVQDLDSGGIEFKDRVDLLSAAFQLPPPSPENADDDARRLRELLRNTVREGGGR